jgi:hypothetical protein
MSWCPCCPRSWGYPYAEASDYAWPETPPTTGRTREEQLAAQLRNVLEELAAMRRELDEIRHFRARRTSSNPDRLARCLAAQTRQVLAGQFCPPRRRVRTLAGQ